MKPICKRYTATIIASLCLFTGSTQSIGTRMDALLDDALLNNADASVAVYDLTADKLLYEHRANKLCRPASVQKLITTITALDRLGTDYTLHTELRYTGTLGADSILHGDLYVVGGFVKPTTAYALDGLDVVFSNKTSMIETGLVLDMDPQDQVMKEKGICNIKSPSPFEFRDDDTQKKIPVQEIKYM